MEHKPFVYGLYDPADAGHIRYVGMAPTTPSRPYAHAKRAQKTTDDSHLLRWIRKIQAEGREPSVMILEEVPNCSGRMFLGFLESCYIKSLRSIGHHLTNENEGGWGGSNGPHSEESRAKMRAGWTPEVRAYIGEISRKRGLGRKHTEETRAKMSTARRLRKITEEQKVKVAVSRKAAWDNATPEQRAEHAARISVAKTGRPGKRWTDASRAKLSASLTGRVQSDEWRAKNAAAQLGKKQSPETKAKRSASLKAAWARRKGGAMAEDPRTDRHPETGVPGPYPTPPGEPKEAPGGAGTGDRESPENEPAAQPDSDKR